MKPKVKDARVACPFCTKDVALTRRGFIHLHRPLGWTRKEQVCLGSGMRYAGADEYVKFMQGKSE